MAELAMLADQQLNHKVVTHPASSLAQDRESSPAETSVLTTMLRCQLTVLVYYKDWNVFLSYCMVCESERTVKYMFV